jgi:hypothetical protein
MVAETVAVKVTVLLVAWAPAVCESAVEVGSLPMTCESGPEVAVE